MSIEVIFYDLGDLIIGLAPRSDSQAIALIFGDKTFIKLLRDLSSTAFAFGNLFFYAIEIWVVVLRNGNTRNGFVLEGEILNSIGDTDGNFCTIDFHDLSHNLGEVLLVLNFVVVIEAFEFFRNFVFAETASINQSFLDCIINGFIKEDTAKGSITLFALCMNADWAL